jgi:anthranilate synthase component 2
MILILDNYDSFTFNLVRYCRELGAEVVVERPEGFDVAAAVASDVRGFIISPGPGDPRDAIKARALAEACTAAERPLLGVCLGHQVIALANGAGVFRADRPMHGKTTVIEHDKTGLFRDLPSPMEVMQYNSLTVKDLPQGGPLLANASGGDGSIQGLRHRELPIHGVQFHPESVASQSGYDLIANFLRLAN